MADRVRVSNEEKPEHTPRKKSLIRRILKVIIWFFIGVILFNLLLYILLSIPAIQNKLVGYAIDKLKERLKTEVSIDEIQLRLFDHLWVNGLYIEDLQKDTLLYAKELDVHLNPLQLLNDKLQINSISLDDFVINVNKKDSLSDYNFQFIIDAFASDTTNQKDTTTSSLKIVINDIAIGKGRLRYDVLSDTLTPGIFNPSHISVSDFKADINLNSIDTKSLNISLNELSAKEKSGLEIKQLNGKVYSKGDQLWTKGLTLMLPNSKLSLDTAEYNLADNTFKLTTKVGTISLNDVKAFMPQLSELSDNVELDAVITGKLPMINLNNLQLKYGEELLLKGNAYIADYENYGKSDIRLSIDNFKATPVAITDIARLGDSTFVTPDILTNWGTLYLKGNIGGKLSNFTTKLEAWGKQGALNLDGKGSVDTTFNKFDVTAHLETKGINLGNLLGPETGLGKLALRMDIKANQSKSDNLTAQVHGVIDKLQYQDSINLNNIQLTANYDAKEIGATINADMPIIKLRAIASMTQEKVPDIKFNINIDRLKVNHFYNNPQWKNPVLSLTMNGNIKGLDIDAMTGNVVLDSIDFHGDNFVFRPDKFTLDLIKNEDKNRQISLKSGYLSANISGYYTFAALSDEFSSIIHGYLPDLTNSKKLIRKWQNDFTFELNIKNTEKLSQIFDLPVDIIEPLTINAHVNTINRQIDFKGNAPLINMSGTQIKNTIITMNGVDSAFHVAGKSIIGMENGSYNIGLDIKSQDKAIHTLLNASSNDTVFKMNGNLEAMIRFAKDAHRNLITKLNLYPTYINLGKLKLQMLPATITNIGSRTEINNFGIAVAQTGKKYMGIDGVISKSENDSVCLWFDKAQIGDILSAFNVNTIKAEIDGTIRIRNVQQDHPELRTKDFKISEIVMFADTIGSLYLDSRWNKDAKGLEIKSFLRKTDRTIATMAGMVYPRQDSLDMHVVVDRFPVGWAQPFVASMLNRLDGSLSMSMKIDGKISTPHVTGFLGLNNAAVGIDYTNVTYYVSDTIKINPDYIGFKNLKIKDSEGNLATVDATVTHKDFQDMKYTVNMRIPQKLMVLNTVTRTDSMFYGKIYASGNVDITGSDKGVNMYLKVKNGKNSNINIIVPQTSEAVDYRSVVFINVPEEKKIITPAPVEDESLPLKMNMDIEVTPDFQLGILLDPLTNTTLKANGKGLINFTYDMASDNMTTFGDYTLHEGSVKMNLQGIKSFEFKIQEGGKLKFVGDPMNTNFDITAYRRVKADLRTLSNSFEADGATRTMVDCVLGIKGNMNKMELTYDISLPDADDDTKRKIKSLISTDEERIRQFAYLLATNSFYNLSGGGSTGGSITDGMWTNLASSTISGALNAMFGSILGQNWEVGTTLESNDGTFSNMDMSVNVSTRLFDDRLRLKTNVGYRNDMYNGGQNEFIGDFDAEYQLNKAWVLRAYNHTNDHYYRQAAYTQGVGIVYTKDAKTLKQLFRLFKRRRPKDEKPASVNVEQKSVRGQAHKAEVKTSGSK